MPFELPSDCYSLLEKLAAEPSGMVCANDYLSFKGCNDAVTVLDGDALIEFVGTESGWFGTIRYVKYVRTGLICPCHAFVRVGRWNQESPELNRIDHACSSPVSSPNNLSIRITEKGRVALARKRITERNTRANETETRPAEQPAIPQNVARKTIPTVVIPVEYDPTQPAPDVAVVYRRFMACLDAVTVPCADGRKVLDVPGAVMLSSVATDLFSALGMEERRITKGGKPIQPQQDGTFILPDGTKVALHGSDHPNGPFEIIPPNGVIGSLLSVSKDNAQKLAIA